MSTCVAQVVQCSLLILDSILSYLRTVGLIYNNAVFIVLGQNMATFLRPHSVPLFHVGLHLPLSLSGIWRRCHSSSSRVDSRPRPLGLNLP